MNPSQSSGDAAALRRELQVANLKIVQMHSQLMNTRRHAYSAAAMERCRFRGTPPRGIVEFRAQFGEDCFLYELFEGRQQGFYIEAGAFNGVDLSVTYAFEQLGWQGLLVEALPGRAEECRVRRPHSRVVHAALGGPGDSPTLSFLSTQDPFGGMLSRAEGPATRPLPPGMRADRVTVPVATLDQLLDGQNVPIDFVVLDMEGSEMRALAGFSLERFKPRVLMIEDLQLGGNSDIMRYMAAKPYDFACWIELNAVFIHREERSLRDRFASMQAFGL